MRSSSQRPDAARVAVLAAAAFLVLTVAGRWAGRALGVEVPLAPGGVLALGAIWGAPVALGAAVAAVALDLALGHFGVWTGLTVLEQALLVGVGATCWGRFGRLSAGRPPGALGRRVALEFGALSATAAVLVGAATATAAVLLGLAPFPAVFADVVGDVVTSALVAGSLVWVGASAATARSERVAALLPTPRAADAGRDGSTDAGRDGATDSGRDGATDSGRDGATDGRRDGSTDSDLDGATDGRRSTLGTRLFSLAAVWGVAGTAIGLAVQLLSFSSEDVLINRAGRHVATAVSLAGPGGWRLHLVLAVVVLAAAVWTLRDAGGATRNS